MAAIATGAILPHLQTRAFWGRWFHFKLTIGPHHSFLSHHSQSQCAFTFNAVRRDGPDSVTTSRSLKVAHFWAPSLISMTHLSLVSCGKMPDVHSCWSDKLFPYYYLLIKTCQKHNYICETPFEWAVVHEGFEGFKWVIKGLAVPTPTIHILKCPWARHWTQIASNRAMWQLGRQQPPIAVPTIAYIGK